MNDEKASPIGLQPRETKEYEEHYICLGGCRGVSKIPDVCQTPSCANHLHELVKCNCTDGLHHDFRLEFFK